MTQQHEALRLADALMEPVVLDKHMMQAADELRRMHDLLGKANALCRIRAGRIRELETALRQAVEALESVYGKGKRCEAAITTAKQALGEKT